MSRFASALEDKGMVISVEVTPPRGAEAEPVLKRAEKLRGVVDVIDVTACPMARLHMSAPVFGSLLRDRLGVDVIVNFTTRDKNVLGIQSDLLGAHALGIRNVVALRGDRMAIGDFPDSPEIFEVDTVGLLRIIENLNNGRDAKGRPIAGATEFFAGSVLNPGNASAAASLRERIMTRMEQNVKFFITQPLYTREAVYRLSEALERCGTPHVLLGILPLKNTAMARRVANGLPGVHVPRELLERLEDKSDDYIREFSLEHSVSIMESAAETRLSGFHIMTAGDFKYAKRLIETFRRTGC